MKYNYFYTSLRDCIRKSLIYKGIRLTRRWNDFRNTDGTQIGGHHVSRRKLGIEYIDPRPDQACKRSDAAAMFVPMEF